MGMGVLERICMDGVPGGKLEDGCVCVGWVGGWGACTAAAVSMPTCPLSGFPWTDDQSPGISRKHRSTSEKI